MIAACTLTHLMTNSQPPASMMLDEYEERYRPLINAFKIEYQKLQLDILADTELRDISDTLGKSFERLDQAFQNLIDQLKRS